MERFVDLAEAGQYYQMSQEILLAIPEMAIKDLQSLYTGVITANHYNMHPDSFAEIVALIAGRLGDEEANSVLWNALELLCRVQPTDDLVSIGLKMAHNGSVAAARLLLEIAHRRISLGDIAGARVILYDCKDLPIESKEVTRRLHLGMGRLHCATCNYSPAFTHLLAYLAISPLDEQAFQECLLAGVKSERVHSFTRLIGLVTTANNTPTSLPYQLACALEAGEASQARHLSQQIDPSLADKVEQKALIIKLLNYFFSNRERTVHLSHLSQHLNLPPALLETIILDILGSGFMRGTIDQIASTFTYTWMGYKHLTNPELSTIRQDISSLRSRVLEVIQETKTRQ
ncbi:26S proteasome regulatory subunit N9 [Nematocida homosporus]|uniref:26S proteasome regulatory subunit N9 n=1 Tax=Nematocida homosporus TaxID=1912981 RepID=UPI0022208FE7|nr:26S proteasome regulatory subunit N9 [Nematocida homosporus]KAI5185414.1 26S proteasome regulatory subunit N9 [Nematocida homosporus]